MGELVSMLPAWAQRVEGALGLAMIAVAVGTVIYQGLRLWRVAASQRWPSVPGLIVRSRACVKRQHHSPSGGVRSSDIRYRYRVDDVAYESDVVCLGGQWDTSFGGPAERRLLRYPEGEAVEVYFDPANPRRACLERKTEAAMFPILIAAAFALLGLLLVSGVISMS
jgi:hypothetical protein